MSTALCTQCGAELIPGTGFCRCCGAAVTSPADAAEQPTVLLDPTSHGDRTTQRLDPVSASGNVFTQTRSITARTSAFPSKRKWFVAALVLVIVCVVGVTFGLVQRVRKQARQRINNSLTYPGATTVVSFADDGGSALQIQTSDQLEKVVSWYEARFNPTKTMRVPPNTVIMKRNNVTVTIVGASEETSVVIKQAGP